MEKKIGTFIFIFNSNMTLCIQYKSDEVRQLRKKKKTVLFVTHFILALMMLHMHSNELAQFVERIVKFTNAVEEGVQMREDESKCTN